MNNLLYSVCQLELVMPVGGRECEYPIKGTCAGAKSSLNVVANVYHCGKLYSIFLHAAAAGWCGIWCDSHTTHCPFYDNVQVQVLPCLHTEAMARTR